MTTKIVLAVLLSLAFLSKAPAQELFHTSVCYDLLSSIDKFEEKGSLDQFYTETGLINDSLFIACASTVHKNVRASNLCNIFSTAQSDKNDIQSCIDFFKGLNTQNVPPKYQGAWLDRIIHVKEELIAYLTALQDAGYGSYWEEHIEPKLLKSIADYDINPVLLDSIHQEINILAGPEPLSDEYPKTYVLDIDNAFNLLDETFCTTYLLLDKEIAKKFRIDFIQVYIHENLHRLRISRKTIQRLNNLKQSDEFYQENETRAMAFNEGMNEAFVVAAESHISQRLGLKTASDVHEEFATYCDGTLVLAPIIYIHFTEKHGDETFDAFINSLFDEKKIAAGKVREQHAQAMKMIEP